ncbi:MAG: hypothetical protein NTX87_20385 [Planctomycetota bacterium]|nr:hypothetical protein [Planctomycetota bacterium]
MSLYVAFVEGQVELTWQPSRKTRGHISDEGVQGICQAGHILKVRRRQPQGLRPALGQHLPDPLVLFSLLLPVLGHLLAEVLRIEDKAVEEEPRGHIPAALLALVSANLKNDLSAACLAPLKSRCRIKLVATGLAHAHTFAHHGQPAAASRTCVVPKHHIVEEPPGPLNETSDGASQAEGNAYDVPGFRTLAHWTWIPGPGAGFSPGAA